ncbi:MAG: tail fiber domain-containing protein [Candidatus Omnitrophica bacterium]|nr:tail fiber domain-containing protein [Candidatus Omnitrophota bacterium]
MKKKRGWQCMILVVLHVISFSLPTCFAQQREESLVITTYYPSPHGSYLSLQSYRLGIGDNNGDNQLTSADIPTTNGHVWISGRVGIGTTNVDKELKVNGTVYANSYECPSDVRLKENIAEVNGILNKLLNINVYRFQWKNRVYDNGFQYGVLAQEVKDYFPELVTQDSAGYLGLKENQINALLLQAVKEQQKKIEELEARIKALERLR